jgi:hypothetical protein
MGRKRKPRGYRVHGLDSPEGQNELAKQDLTRADLEQAITAHERAEKPGSEPSSASARTACSDRAARTGARISPTPSRSR